MKLIVGLGNPGTEYRNNRHNIGFHYVDFLAEKIAGTNSVWKSDQKINAEVYKVENMVFVKPQTFMNRSGEAVQRLVQFYKLKPADVVVIHDDLDIRFGEYKIARGKGPKGHNGIKSLEDHIGKEFARIRIGVENRDPETLVSGVDYVLSNFTDTEMGSLGPLFNSIHEAMVSFHKELLY